MTEIHYEKSSCLTKEFWSYHFIDLYSSTYELRELYFFRDFNAGIEHSVLKDLQFVSPY